MPKAVLTKTIYGGRSIFRIGKDYYVINSRHMTRKNAENSTAYKDSFYFGKTRSKIVKYGRYWIVLQRLPQSVESELVKRKAR